MKIGFLFAGQGAQYLGMGRDLYEQEKQVRDTFIEASNILGYDLAQLIFTDEAKLNETKYTQPAILTLSVAIWRILHNQGIIPDIVAGLSLGEYSALVASDALDFKTAVALVAKRAQLMAEAAPKGVGKMVAVLNAKPAVIEEACKKASQFGIVSPANYNTPNQIVIGGEVRAVDKAMEFLKEANVKRLIELKVSVPSHTSLMISAAEKLALELEKVNFNKFSNPLISNTTAKIMPFNEIKNLLTRQIKEPLKFSQSIETMLKFNVDTFIEIGPGKVLSGFVRKIAPEKRITHVENVATFEQTMKILEEYSLA